MSVELLEPETKVVETIDRAWNVVVWDDPINTMSYVTHVFQKVFSMREEEAAQKMMEVHTRGRSNVFSGGKEKAEYYVHQLQSYGLNSTIEREE